MNVPLENKTNNLYNLDELRTSAAGDVAFVAEMVKLFISQNESALPEIRTSLACRDYAKIKSILHKMKPSVMVMGVHTASEIIHKIERLDMPAPDEQVFADLCLKIEMILLEVNDQLRSF